MALLRLRRADTLTCCETERRGRSGAKRRNARRRVIGCKEELRLGIVEAAARRRSRLRVSSGQLLSLRSTWHLRHRWPLFPCRPSLEDLCASLNSAARARSERFRWID